MVHRKYAISNLMFRDGNMSMFVVLVYREISLCIYIYICSRPLPPPPHDPPEPASCKQWIIEGGQPQMRKHRQDSICPKFAKLILGILGKFEPGDVSSFQHFREIRAWRYFGNLRYENIARLEFPKIPET